MKKNGKKFLLLLLTSIIFFGVVTFVKAQSCDSSCASDDLTCISNKISDCNNKISTLQSQANTLSNQIAQFNAQITLTALKIADTENKIAQLGGRIDQLEVSLNNLTQAFSSRAVETYKTSRFENGFMFLLTATDINDAVARFHYLTKIQEEDTNLMQRLQEAQTAYKGQKADQETLQKQLEVQKANLDSQKAAKASLLAVTRNDEARYQQLLAQARAEYEAIQGILAGQGQETQVGHIDAGAKIASIIPGPSCNSGGEHLHFMIAQNGQTSNPFNYLRSGVYFDNCSGSSCGSPNGDPFNPSGSWDWPISPKIEFNQGYGVTWAVQNIPWVRSIYNFHNGIDIDSASSLDVRAVRPGVLFRGAYGVGCNLRYVRIHNDDDGLDTFYLHVDYVM